MSSESLKAQQDSPADGAVQDPNHFARRRRILEGLAGVPLLLTFRQSSGAVESFARCVNYALGTSGDPQTTVRLFVSSTAGLDEKIYWTSATPCSPGADLQCAPNTNLSGACMGSFFGGGGVVNPEVECLAACPQPEDTGLAEMQPVGDVSVLGSSGQGLGSSQRGGRGGDERHR